MNRSYSASLTWKGCFPLVFRSRSLSISYRRHRFPGRHPARRVTVPSLHPKLSRCRGAACRAWPRPLPTKAFADGCSNSDRRSLGACDGAVLDRAIAGMRRRLRSSILRATGMFPKNSLGVFCASARARSEHPGNAASRMIEPNSVGPRSDSPIDREIDLHDAGTPPRQFAARDSQLLQQARAPVRGSTTGKRSGAGASRHLSESQSSDSRLRKTALHSTMPCFGAHPSGACRKLQRPFHTRSQSPCRMPVD